MGDIQMEYNGQAKKGLDCSIKIWENVHTEIWYTQYSYYLVLFL